MQKKLVLVIAPAGYGKTTLLIDYAYAAEIPCCWYAIDQSDIDLSQFLMNFITAIEHHYPGFGDISIELIHNLFQPEVSLERMIAVLVNEIFKEIKEDFLFVLDNFHMVDGNPDIQLFISQFVQKVGENCHLNLLSRREPILPDFELLDAQGQVGYLGLLDLTFQPEEIQLLVSQNYDHILSLEEAKKLVQDTEGWITGLLLQPLLDRRGDWSQAYATKLPGPRLNQYLEKQILESSSSRNPQISLAHLSL